MRLPTWLTGPDPGAAVTAALAASDVYGPSPTTIGVKTPFRADDHLVTVTWRNLVPDATVVPVTREEAMSVPAIARARHVLTSTLGRVDLVARRGGRDGEPVASPLLQQPDRAGKVSRFVQIVWTVDDLVFHGRSVWYAVDLDADGRPLSLRRYAPHRVRGEQRGRRLVVLVDDVEVDPARLVVIDGPHEGILTFGANAVRHAADLERSAARVARNPVPAMELHAETDYPYTDDEIDALIDRWVKARQGENGAVGWTGYGITAKPHGAPAEHLLTHGRNASAVDAARLVSVPADVVDAAPERASMTYANVESRNRTLIDYGLAAYAAAIEARLSLDDVLPHGTGAYFALDQLTEPSAVASSSSPAPTPTAPEVPA